MNKAIKVTTIQFDTWEELLAAIERYSKMGIKTEVRGWDNIRNNILTVMEVVHNERA